MTPLPFFMSASSLYVQSCQASDKTGYYSVCVCVCVCVCVGGGGGGGGVCLDAALVHLAQFPVVFLCASCLHSNTPN